MNRTGFYPQQNESRAACLILHLSAHVNAFDSERTEMNLLLASCKSPSSDCPLQDTEREGRLPGVIQAETWLRLLVREQSAHKLKLSALHLQKTKQRFLLASGASLIQLFCGPAQSAT